VSGPPISFAHRGARAVRRENTLEAFRHALVLGATGLESDVWLTSDGLAVLDHDGVTGPPWHRRLLSAQPRAELPVHIPSLEELYRECGSDFELSLDIKDPAAVDETLRVARRFGAAQRLWLCDPDVARLGSWARRAEPAKLVNSTHLDDMKDGLAARLADLRDAGVSALNMHGSEWTAQRVEQTHEAGLLAFGWDAQKDEHIQRLLRFGVDGIYSDHVDRLVHAIAAAG
jgi:glycerophosphoryl diester phosphodiesterase